MKQLPISQGYDEMLCKIEMQERALHMISKEVFDNIGQTLCLAKMHIASLQADASLHQQKIISDATNLVFKAIHNLRKMTRRSDANEVINYGFVAGLEKEIAFFNNLHEHYITLKTNGKNTLAVPSQELRIFCMLQEFFSDNFFTSANIFASVTVTFRTNEIQIIIKQHNSSNHAFYLSEGVKEKSILINAKIQTTNTVRYKKITWTINLQHGKDCVG